MMTALPWFFRAVTILALLVLLTPAVAAPRQAPAFDVSLFGGGTFRLSDQKGTAVVLLFWAPW